jgi:uncharacterized Zn finger protein (UPF0148 family)
MTTTFCPKCYYPMYESEFLNKEGMIYCGQCGYSIKKSELEEEKSQIKNPTRRAYVRLTRGVDPGATEILLTVPLSSVTIAGMLGEIRAAVEPIDADGVVIDSVSFHEVRE